MRYTDECIVTDAQAAELIDRPRTTIRRWAHEGRIKPVGRIGRTPYYLEADVLRVDAQLAKRPA